VRPVTKTLRKPDTVAQQQKHGAAASSHAAAVTWRRFFSTLCILCAAFCVLACAKKEEVIIETASGKELTAADIDRDPLALLPGGAVAVAYLDAQKLFASQFGDKLLAIAQKSAPVPASAGYEPRRDLTRLYVGVYSMQGIDLAGVAIGTFDTGKIEKAAESGQTTPLGAPLVKTTYAGRALYTSRDVGFSIVTSHTALFGNQTGMRRALDRIKEGKVERQVPPWLQKMLELPNAPVIIGLDLRAHPIPDATRAQLKFLDGLETAGIVGNFEHPGLNLAGTLSYSSPEASQRGAANLVQLRQQLQSYGFLMALFGLSQPLKRLDAQPKGKEAEFVAEVDGRAVSQLLDMADKILPKTNN
jgi:hypothetical protein